MSDFSSQNPGTTNFTSKNNNFYVNAEAVQFGVGDINSSEGITMS